MPYLMEREYEVPKELCELVERVGDCLDQLSINRSVISTHEIAPDFPTLRFSQEQRPQRRQRQPQRIGPPMSLFCKRLGAAHVAGAAASIFAGIAVEKFFPVAAHRNANQVSHSGHRREIE